LETPDQPTKHKQGNIPEPDQWEISQQNQISAESQKRKLQFVSIDQK